MKVIIDNFIAQQFAQDPTQIAKHTLFEDENNHIAFRWPSLLEYLGLGSLFSELPVFDADQPLYEGCIAALREYEERETLHYVFDRLFTENLNQIVELPQMKEDYILKEITQRKTSLDTALKNILAPALTFYEASFSKFAPSMMHNLVLYLAWERMCTQMSLIFDYQSPDAKFIAGIKTLQECLVESFQHITQQGRTAPSIFRLFEALFFYYMREEHLQKHTDEEWNLLSKGFKALKTQERPADVFYIDDAVTAPDKPQDPNTSDIYLTVDPSDKTDFRIAFSQLMIQKISSEFPDWNFGLTQQHIVHLGKT